MKAKIIPLTRKTRSPKKEDQKLSLEECKSILNTKGRNYTDEEIEKVRDYLYLLAEIECRYFEQWQNELLDKKSNLDHDANKESIPLYPGIHRRAS